MTLLNSLKTLLSPKQAEFSKRLRSKRKELAQDRLIAGLAVKGTAAFRLRSAGLSFLEYAFSPEATITQVLAKYWEPSIHNFHFSSPPFGNQNSEQSEKNRANDIAGTIEFELTGKADAATHLPSFEKFTEYLRYRVKKEHPKLPYLGSEYGFTEEFYEYALYESRHVFKRS